ncbi:MAG: hypothetical protein GTO02_18240, partial [Candidatus Dadabacteria bacterium]|nr:hypothetical protein [Candidatus Dadabacteria bacterium]
MSTKTIEEAGLYSSNSDEINRILKRNDIQTNGIVIPYDDGNFKRVRLDNPIIIDGNEAKYLSPSGSKNKLYIP